MNVETVNKILGITESYKSPEVIMKKLMNKEYRENMFKEFLKYETDMKFDWFHEYFQDDHADRKNLKQDFTPESITRLLSDMVGSDGSSVLDITAGTGGMLITRWHEDRIQNSPFNYHPSDYYYGAEELSDRALPFLLFNMSIRGMNGHAVHGDALTREVNNIYFIQNDKDDYMHFSSINVMPQTKATEDMFNVKRWIGEPINHIESGKTIIKGEEVDWEFLARETIN